MNIYRAAKQRSKYPLIYIVNSFRLRGDRSNVLACQCCTKCCGSKATLNELLFTKFHDVFPLVSGFERTDNYFIQLLTKSNKCVQYKLVH